MIRELLERGASSHTSIIVAGEGPALSYDHLRGEVDSLVSTLRRLGIQRTAEIVNAVKPRWAAFNLLARDNNGESQTMRRVRIADNLVYAIGGAEWGGNGTFMQIGEGPPEITVEHNTIIQSGNVLTAYGGSRDAPSVAERFVFRNNITRHNQNGVVGQGLGAGSDSINAFFPGAIFLRNALAGGRASRYPGDNLFPEMDQFSRQFVNDNGRDYRLKSDSEFRRAATDGADLGVNFVMLARTIGARAREWLGLSQSTP